jgi:hypothetical protein
MGNEEALMCQDLLDPMTVEKPLGDTSAEFTKQYFDNFKKPLPEDPRQVELFEEVTTGWLVWGKTIMVTHMVGNAEVAWPHDPECLPGLEVIASIVQADGWWTKVSLFLCHSAPLLT